MLRIFALGLLTCALTLGCSSSETEPVSADKAPAEGSESMDEGTEGSGTEEESAEETAEEETPAAE